MTIYFIHFLLRLGLLVLALGFTLGAGVLCVVLFARWLARVAGNFMSKGL